MDQRSDPGMKGFFEEMAEDLGNDEEVENRLQNRRRSEGFQVENKPFVYGAIGVVVLVALIVLIFKGGDKVSTKEFEEVKAQAAKVEKRLAQIEASGEKASGFATRIEGLQQGLARTDGAIKSLDKRLDQLSKRVEQPPITKKAEPAAVSKKVEQETKKTPAKTVVPADSGERFHIVQQGESLYGIAKKYGTSLAELRRLNKMSPIQEIQTGQKLIVPSNKGQ